MRIESKLLERFLKDREIKKDEKTIIAYEIDVRQFLEYFMEEKNISADEVFKATKRYELDDYLEKIKATGGRNGEKAADSTYNRKVISLKEVYKFLFYRELIDKNTAEHLETIQLKVDTKLNGIKKSLTIEEIKEIKRVAGDLNSYKNQKSFQCSRDKLMFYILFNLGLRCEELRELKLQDIDMENAILNINKAKKDSVRSIAISTEGMELLKYYLVDRELKNPKCDNLFISMRSTKITRNESVTHILKSLLDKTSFSEERKKEITVHKTRHTFATQSVRAGEDVGKISRILGHKSINTTLNFYVHNNTVQDILDNKIECNF